jgi:type I restriction-modification system DNA methylase subunit
LSATTLAQGRAPQGLRPPRPGQAAARAAHQSGQRHRLGSPADRAKDVLGRVYEYFLSQFASAEGKKGGQFYTPSHVVRVLVEVLAPYKGRVYDPCCGSGGMFVQSEKFIEAHSGRIGDISIYGQESNYTTWRLAKMNLAIRGIDAQIAHGDTFHADKHPDLKADYVLANPPFNDSDWRGELLKEDKRWVYGMPTRRQRQLRLGAALHLSPRAHRAGRIRAGQRLHVVESVRRGRDSEEDHRS